MDLADRRVLAFLLLPALLLGGLPAGLQRVTAAPRTQTTPVESHPRLWLTSDDLPRLRGWANESNPLWQDGLLVRADDAKAAMDAGTVPSGDTGNYYYEDFPTESYAEFFAFLSLVHPDETTRNDYAQRARTLLMFAMNEAAKGPAVDQPFRDPQFAGSHSDRSRWWGEGWALTVDWIYPSLSTEDKAAIRAVFLRWCEEIVMEGYHHAEPIGITDDPSLYADPNTLRWSGNNYLLAHMRNLGLMAMALDSADDPGGELHNYLKIAVGANLFMVDHLLRTDAAGGLAPEGFEYSPQAVGYVVQFMLALHTAGQDDPAVWGPQVRFDANPFWDEMVPAFLHAISPTPTTVPGEDDVGQVYQPAWYGDGQNYWAPDMIGLFGPLGIYDELTGNTEQLGAIRWIQSEAAPGGATKLAERVADNETLTGALLYFVLFDPSAPAPVDPRPALPLYHFATGLGRLSARTGWDADAAWFTYALGWIAVDHQFGDGNQIEFYRDGEWLTKGLVGWGSQFADGDPSDDYYFPSSEYHNTLALENDPPLYNDPSAYTHELWKRGSQWEYTPSGDPTILAMSIAPGYVYTLGDATNLYNSSYEGPVDILQATRSVVWLAPDTIVVYDRAASKTENRFKRFWLNLPAAATVDGNQTTMTTASGQHLVISTLAPAGITPTVAPLDVQIDDLAIGEPMRYRFLLEAPGNPQEIRFLNVLQGVDASGQAAPVVSLDSEDGAYTGTVVQSTAVLFPVNLGAAVSDLRMTIPTGTTAYLITGLTPGAGYDLTTADTAGGVDVTLTAGATYHADEGGALLVGTLPAALGISSFAFSQTPAVTAPLATPEANPSTETVEPETAATPAVVASNEDETAVSGSGQIVYKVYDSDAAPGHIYRIEIQPGATPQDLSAALDAVSPGPDAWVNVSADGAWLVLGTERFDPECTGWACLAVVPADLSTGEVIRTANGVIHPDGPAAIVGNTLIVYPATDGPHEQDLWAIQRSDTGWGEPVLLTADSPYAYQFDPALANDGSRVVFDCADQPYEADGTSLCEVATDATGFRVVLTPADAPAGLPTTGALTHPTYGPDGSIVFSADWSGESIWRLPSGDAPPVPVGPAFTNDSTPCVLPDGRIASLWFDRPGGKGVHELNVMTPDGTSYAVLVKDVDIESIGCGGKE